MNGKSFWYDTKEHAMKKQVAGLALSQSYVMEIQFINLLQSGILDSECQNLNFQFILIASYENFPNLNMFVE